MSIVLKEGWRMLQRARHVRKNGFRRYQGTAEEICKQIIDDAYDPERKYFRVSSGHFCEFYVRDFAFCASALLELGHEEKVHDTLMYALSRFRHQGRITTAISPAGVPFDYFLPSGPESIGLFLYTLRIAKHDVRAQDREFLQTQVDRVVRMMDPKTLLPRRGARYSTIRDQTRRDRPCYDAVMLALVAREARLLGLSFPHSCEEIRDAVREEYWNGTYFFQDARKQGIVVGDANVFPFWTGIFADEAMRTEASTAIQAAVLDQPFPLRYVNGLDRYQEKTSFHVASLFSQDYETDSIWAHLGLCHLEVLADADPALARKHLASYRALIERHKTFLELYDRNGDPYRTPFYVTDEAMLWCAIWLALERRLG